MTCKDCVHYEVCKFIGNLYYEDEKCHRFKPKSRFVELPCEVGQTVYDITEFVEGVCSPQVYEMNDNQITIKKGKDGKITFVYDGMYLCNEDMGKTMFLSEKEAEKGAEKALKERESDGKIC